MVAQLDLYATSPFLVLKQAQAQLLAHVEDGLLQQLPVFAVLFKGQLRADRLPRRLMAVNPGVLASGQVVGLIDDLPTCEELIDRVVTGAVAELRRGASYVV